LISGITAGGVSVNLSFESYLARSIGDLSEGLRDSAVREFERVEKRSFYKASEEFRTKVAERDYNNDDLGISNDWLQMDRYDLAYQAALFSQLSQMFHSDSADAAFFQGTTTPILNTLEELIKNIPSLKVRRWMHGPHRSE
jgi:hypothetical protein